ncbi:methyl-accepting chemotaxis protein [Halorubellus sp. PRR65]|uniref:methyl-accepting chemotaxis protein n=1 Tax=Halorubellus sp. PRR65 TaxID=3098148 RepID=UPI002B259F23|nr:methyl-accepting chemotaxis protein [Halorubellus sp. PRR65]
MLGSLRRVVPNAIRRRYALKFGIVMLCLGVVVAGIGVAATTQVQNEVEDGAKAEYEQISRQESAKLATWNEQNERLASHLSGTLAVRRGGLADIESLFENRTDRRGIYRLDYVDLRESEVVVSTRRAENRSLSSLDITDAERLRTVSTADGGGFYGAYERNSVEAMTYAAATPDGDHAVLVTMDAGTVAADLKGATENGAVAVLDPQKQIIFDSQSEEGTGKYLTTYDAERADRYVGSTSESPGFSASVVTGPASGVLVGEEGYGLPSEQYVAGYSPVEGTDWVVVVHEPTTTAFGFVKQVRQYGLLVTGGIVVLIGLVGLVLGRNTARSVDDLRGNAQRMEDGDLEVDFDSVRIDAIGQLYAGFASMRDALREQIRDAQEAREAAEQARAEAEEMNEHLERKADEYATVMQACADGDLTERMDPASESDAMESIAVEFNEMVAEIESTTAEVKAFASEVATASEQVTASSEEVRSASQQVTESIQEISDGAERQNESLQSVSGEMEQLSTTTEEIAASSNEVADLAERTVETGREGRAAAEAAIDGMAALESDSESAVAAIEALEDEMSEIDELIEFIGDIAKETNMLALNANIEASRGTAEASDDGDEGFAVVAQEVKELASETKDAAEDIESRLESIQDQTEHTASEVQQTADRVAEHTRSVRDAAGALDEIAEYAAETNDGVQEISAATEQQAASTEEVVAMVDDAATVSEETTAEAENVAAAAEEQTTALTEVSNSASSLSEQASRLSAALDRFDTAAEPDDDDVVFDEETVASAFDEHADGEPRPADVDRPGESTEPEFDAFGSDADADGDSGASDVDGTDHDHATSDTGDATGDDGGPDETSADSDGSDDETFTFGN